MIRFNKEFDKNCELVIKATEDTIRETAKDLFSSIVKSTPVDTGQLRGNWFASFNEPLSTPIIGKLDKSGLETITDISEVVSKYSSKSHKVIYMSNSLDYANRIEYGQHSNQAPFGMVRVNVARFQHTLEKNAKENKTT